jgi:hypothetical protein
MRRGVGSTATGIRTRVSAMRGRRPSPLDDSGAQIDGVEASKATEAGSAPRCELAGQLGSNAPR